MNVLREPLQQLKKVIDSDIRNDVAPIYQQLNERIRPLFRKIEDNKTLSYQFSHIDLDLEKYEAIMTVKENKDISLLETAAKNAKVSITKFGNAAIIALNALNYDKATAIMDKITTDFERIKEAASDISESAEMGV
jgi:hypothetical protein